jgi:hypothetical protein
VASACERLQAEACLVFDRPPGRGFSERPRVTVRVAERPASADDLIRALVDAAASPADLIVVTSDKPLYSYARTRGAKVLRVHEWRMLERGPRIPPE